MATHHLGVVGGAEAYLRSILPLLRERGHEVALLAEAPASPGTSTIDAGVPGAPCWLASGLGAKRALEEVRHWQPELCFQHGMENAELEDALLETIPGVLFAHAYYGTCVSGTKRFAFPRTRPCERTLGPGCLVHHLPRRCGGRNPRSMWAAYALQSRRLSFVRRYRRIIVASHHMAAEYFRHGLPAEQIQLNPCFPTGILPDPAPPAFRPLTGTVLMISRLTELKGAHLLIPALRTAAARLGRPLELILAGDGPERARLEMLGARLKVPIRCMGWVEVGSRTALMRQADLLAVPSAWPEPFGMVGIEAGCVGLPAVAYAVGGIPDWLQPGITGESAPGDSPSIGSLADAVVRALARPDHHARLRVGAWRMARRFTPEAHLATLERVFQEAVPPGPAPRVS